MIEEIDCHHIVLFVASENVRVTVPEARGFLPLPIFL